MSGMDFEYAIRKDVRNNPIVREVDDERQRQVWRAALIGGFLVVLVLFSAWQHFELLQHGYRIQKMQQQRAAQEDINRQLRLEIETLRSPVRIERLAKDRGLFPPTREQAIVIQRVTTSAPPAKSVVAAR